MPDLLEIVNGNDKTKRNRNEKEDGKAPRLALLLAPLLKPKKFVMILIRGFTALLTSLASLNESVSGMAESIVETCGSGRDLSKNQP